MDQLITNYRGLAEFIYFLTGPLILVAIMLAARQLRLTREEIRIRFRREATLLTLDVCDNKLKKTSKLWAEADRLESELKMPPMPEVSGYDQSVFEDDEWYKAFISEDKFQLYNVAIDALNELETFAEYIYSGLGDGELAFQFEGSFFLDLSKDLRPYLAAMRPTAEDESYCNIVELEKEWLERSKRSALIKQHKALGEQIRSIPAVKLRQFLGEKI